MNFDILISGAGPAGLCLARALSGHGLRTAVVAVSYTHLTLPTIYSV